MKKSIFTLAFFVVIAVLGSCKSNSTDPISEEKVDQSQSYYPIQEGYWFEYTSNIASYPSPVRYTMGPSEIKNGKTYNTMTTTISNSAKSYFRMENNILYNLGANALNIDENTEYQFADFGLAVGDSMVILGVTSQGLPVRLVNITAKRGTTYTIGATTYSDVINIHTIGYTKFGSDQWQTYTTYDNYYAKGIGWIAEVAPQFGKIELNDYSFKK